MGVRVNKSLVLAVLLVILGGTLAVQWWASRETPSGTVRPPGSASRTRPGPVDGPADPLEVRLAVLARPRPGPPERGRDLFRLQPNVVAPPPVTGSSLSAAPGIPGGTPTVPAVPSGPPPPPPITLKLIGIVERTQAGQRIAVLSDGKDIFYGRDGDVVDGRFRVLKVGAESVEVSYVDGRGRRVIPLSGS